MSKSETKTGPRHEQPVVRTLHPARTVRHVPLKPHQYTERITPKSDVFILSHMGVPRAEPADWWLDIAGLVVRPQRIALKELLNLPKHQVTALHECAGFPMNPRIATRRYANVVWGGVDLATLLKEVGVRGDARYLWSYGCDRGNFVDVTADVYCKDMPLERLGGGDVLLAYEINGEALSQELGSPLRLVIPGYYGTNAVKWLYRLELQDERPTGPYTTTYYNDVLDGPEHAAGSTRPVWGLAPESVIVSVADGQTLSGCDIHIWGWAWSEAEVSKVEISVDAGEHWVEAEVEDGDRWSWRRFSFQWAPDKPGAYRLMSRATDEKGEMQPLSDMRNCVHKVDVTVVLPCTNRK